MSVQLHVVIVEEDSHASLKALDKCVRFINSDPSSHIVMLHVFRTENAIFLPIGMISPKEKNKNEKKMGKEFLSEIVKKVRQEKNIKNIKGVIYDTNDTVKAAICQFAKENDVNAIWMGRSKTNQSAVSKLVSGTTISFVADNAPCDVHIVR